MSSSRKERLYYLLTQIRASGASPADFQELLDLMKSSTPQEEIEDSIRIFFSGQSAFAPEANPADPDWQAILRGILAVEDSAVKEEVSVTYPAHRVHFLRKWWWAAASVLLLLTLGVYFWLGHKKNIDTVTIANTEEIQPGKDGAILTLADGSRVSLDSLGNGVIALQNGSQAAIKNGELIYNLIGEKTGEVVYNTMTTPKGRQFSLSLPDGTKVWLNAASSIRYPTVFTGKERKVEVTGEAYFEVARNTKMPFRLSVKEKAIIEVLGTHFNVNAYENEATINTTLLEGSVKVNGTTIRPGQQAQIANIAGRSEDATKGGIKVISNTDIDKVMAWKNGVIYFDGSTFDEIMRQLERWYDIKVVYENNKIPNDRLAGKMTKGVSFNDLLKYLGKTGVRYKLDGRILIVSP